MVRKHQTSGAQLRTGESRDSGFDALHRPGMTECSHGISYTTILSAMPRSAACFWRIDHRAGDVDLLRGRQALHPGGDIHGLAKIILPLVEHHRKARTLVD